MLKKPMVNKQLVELYNQASKHSCYQILAEPLRKYIPENLLKTKSRFEQERLDYILEKLAISKAKIVEIGGNTGYFSFELIDRGASSAVFIEGNQAQALFVREAANLLGFQDRIYVQQRYLSFSEDLDLVDCDICLLMNVLHHVGDDYNYEIETIESAKDQILLSLNRLSKCCKNVIFQLGFNWKGNINLPLFEDGEKREVIDFITSGTNDFWDVKDIGIALRTDKGIVYKDLDSTNIERMDALGEFLNRPIFILRSKST